MKKNVLLPVLFFFVITSPAFSQDSYTVIIDGLNVREGLAGIPALFDYAVP
jgi:hypothetical protein